MTQIVSEPVLRIGQIVAEGPKPEAKPLTPAEARPTAPVLAPEDAAVITKAAIEGVRPGADTRRALKIVSMMESAKDTRGKRALESHLKVLKESKDPEDRALAIDFEIAQQQLRLEPQSVIDVIGQLSAERGKIPGNPQNAFHEIAARLGVPAEEAKTNPLGGIREVFRSLATDKKREAQFFEHMQKEKVMGSDEIGAAKDVLRVIRGEPTKLEKTRNFAVKTGGLMAALTLLMAWLASKEKQQGAMG